MTQLDIARENMMANYKLGVLQKRISTVSVVHRILDVLLITIGLILTCGILDQGLTLGYLVNAFCVTMVFQLVSEISGLYRSWRGVNLIKEIKTMLNLWAISFFAPALFLLYTDLMPSLPFNLQWLWFINVGIGFILSRVFVRRIVSYFRSRGINCKNVAIVGAKPLGRHLAAQMINSPWLGFNVVGFYDDEYTGSVSVGNCQKNILGDLAKLAEDSKRADIDSIYITLPMSNELEIKSLVTELSDSTCSVLFAPDVFTFNLLHARNQDINGVPVISIFDTPIVGINALLKRIEDIILSSLILIVISPILLGLSVAVKLTSRGPIVFKQRRYGIDGKPIEVWKFRSMTVMENDDKVVQATKNDSRLTPIGSFIRSTSLDELPQFFNVLKGDMSIVGPRPHAVSHNEQYRKLIQGYMLRHKVKPGITGWAQINGWRGETDTLNKMEKRIEFDLDYIRNWSFWMDMKIICLTIFKGFINRNAY